MRTARRKKTARRSRTSTGRQGFAKHHEFGYHQLLAQDKKRQPRFRFVGVSKFLYRLFWRKYGRAWSKRYGPESAQTRTNTLANSVYNMLVRHGYIKPLGYLKRGHGLGGPVKEFVVYRKSVSGTGRRYKPNKRRQDMPRVVRQRQARRIQPHEKNRSAIGAINPHRPPRTPKEVVQMLAALHRRAHPHSRKKPVGGVVIFFFNRKEKRDFEKQYRKNISIFP